MREVYNMVDGEEEEGIRQGEGNKFGITERDIEVRKLDPKTLPSQEAYSISDVIGCISVQYIVCTVRTSISNLV